MYRKREKEQVKAHKKRFNFKRWWFNNGWWLCYVFTVLFLLIGAVAYVR